MADLTPAPSIHQRPHITADMLEAFVTTPVPRDLPPLTDVVHSSRDAHPGSLFVAVAGEQVDGHDYVSDAVLRGSPVVVVDRPVDSSATVLVGARPTRELLAPLASLAHGAPSAELTMLGVTGTNGKTTTCWMLEGALAAAGKPSGVIGTIATRCNGVEVPGIRTTPEATDLQRLLRQMRDGGAEAVAMEVSSHGLAMHRVDAVQFDAVLFTNLTQDHLDFHDDMQDYFEAKARLFDGTFAPRGVVFADDVWGIELARRAMNDMALDVVLSDVGGDPEHREKALRDACGTISDETRVWHARVATSVAGTTATLTHGTESAAVSTPLVGRVNGLNAAGAWLVATAAGMDTAAAAAGIASVAHIPGRMQRIATAAGDAGGVPDVFVDYAHTPDAVARLVEVARGIATGRTLIVLGCGGDRDRAKRAPMGAAAAEADVAILTSDNPRSEDPASILQQMHEGVADASNTAPDVRIIVDRQVAIATAIREAAAGDVVVIAGKGHEPGQTIGEVTHPFLDAEVAREILRDIEGAA